MKKTALKIISAIVVISVIAAALGACGMKNDANSDDSAAPAKAKVLYSIKFDGEYSRKSTYTTDSEIELDSYGRFKKLNRSNGAIICEYDASGFLSNIDWGQGHTTTAWTFENNMPAKTTQTRGSDSSASSTITYEYNSDNMIKSRREETYLEVPGRVSRTIVTEEYTYDSNKRISSLKYYIDDEYDHSETFKYDSDGNLTYISFDGNTLGVGYINITLEYKEVDYNSISHANTSDFAQFCNLDVITEFMMK